MVIVLSENEKAEPPPYTPRDLSLASSPPSASTSAVPRPTPPGVAPPLPTRTSNNASVTKPSRARNYLRVVRVDEDILGNWEINPSLLSSADGRAQEGPNIYFQTDKGNIDVSVAWVSGAEESAALPRARVEALNQQGNVFLSNTTRPHGLPLHIKATSLKKGDVKICAPPDFHGVLSLRIPGSTSMDWRSRIGLGAKISEQVSCTRETNCTVKCKGKEKSDLIIKGSSSGEQVLVEFLIGSDLELQHFNLAGNAGPGALDMIEVDVPEGRVMVLSSEDAALGNEQFPEVPTTETGRTWKFPGLMPGGGVTFAVRDKPTPAADTGPTGITIVIDEPKWFGAVKKWGVFGGGDSKKGGKLYQFKEASSPYGQHDRKHRVSPHSSTATLVSVDPGRKSTSSPAVSPTLSPLLSPSQHRRRFSATDERDNLPLPPTRSSRSASTSNIQHPDVSLTIPQKTPMGCSPSSSSRDLPHQRSFSEEEFKRTYSPPPAPPGRQQQRQNPRLRGSGLSPNRATIPVPTLSTPTRSQHWEQYRRQQQQQSYLPPRSPPADGQYVPVNSRQCPGGPQMFVRLPDTGARSSGSSSRPGSGGSAGSPGSSTSQKLTKSKPCRSRTKSTPDLREKLRKESRGRN